MKIEINYILFLSLRNKINFREITDSIWAR